VTHGGVHSDGRVNMADLDGKVAIVTGAASEWGRAAG
jgi:hypothetical protein